VAPSKDVHARETSALAAVGNHPFRVTQNQRLTELLRSRSDFGGMSDPEIQRVTGWERSTICARRADVGVRSTGERWTNPKTGRTYTRWRLATDEERRQDEQPAAFDLVKQVVKSIEGRG
jgi:hypothetical protein